MLCNGARTATVGHACRSRASQRRAWAAVHRHDQRRQRPCRTRN
ncbi:primase C-terminal domain-containing protein, partial [Escherichia coli]